MPFVHTIGTKIHNATNFYIKLATGKLTRIINLYFEQTSSKVINGFLGINIQQSTCHFFPKQDVQSNSLTSQLSIIFSVNTFVLPILLKMYTGIISSRIKNNIQVLIFLQYTSFRTQNPIGHRLFTSEKYKFNSEN